MLVYFMSFASHPDNLLLVLFAAYLVPFQLCIFRYEKINQYLHLNDAAFAVPQGEDGHDKLYKVRPIIEHFRQVTAQYWTPDQNLSIDEAMIAFEGRLHMKQYMKGKPTPWGIKCGLALIREMDTCLTLTCVYRQAGNFGT